MHLLDVLQISSFRTASCITFTCGLCLNLLKLTVNTLSSTCARRLCVISDKSASIWSESICGNVCVQRRCTEAPLLFFVLHLHLILMRFCSTWFKSDLCPSLASTPFFSLHPLQHLISLSPSIQIVFIGMTGPVVGDSHRHGRTMHCDGDIHMIIPSDLTPLQIHFAPRLLFSSCFSVCICLCVDFSNDFVALSLCCAPACHSTTLIPLPFSVPACLFLYLYPPLFPSTPRWQSH